MLPNSRISWIAIRLLVLQLAIGVLHYATASYAIADDDTLPAREEAALNAAVSKVAPSVVQIRTLGGLDVVDNTILADGPTTGLVVSADGYIISSAFNFAQQPSSILITFPSGKQVPAELVATDHSRLLVLLKANGVADLPVPQMAPVDEIRPGQSTVAVGRTFRADRTNVTVGIVSAINRMFGKAIQTDADVSTANYGGPLVDIRGRVLGIIVPMSPQATSEVAGVEWYDSGIGFAVPLAPLADRIERMKKGEDQRAGLLGIGMPTKNPHSSKAELAAVRPDSPAGQAGLKKGDRIVELNGKPIHNQSDLRFALGTAYGGDTVSVVAMRGDERLEKSVKLVGELAAFRHAFLGILPMRPAAEATPNENASAKPKPDADAKESKSSDPSPEQKSNSDDSPTAQEDSPSADEATGSENPAGVAVRMVYADSPAAKAGIQKDDRILAINDTKIKSIDDAIQAMNNAAPESSIAVRVARKDQAIDQTLIAAQLPTTVPAELPPAVDLQKPARRLQYAPAKRPMSSCPSSRITAAFTCRRTRAVNRSAHCFG